MEERETKTISFKDIGRLIKENLIFIIVIMVIAAIIGGVYALFVQPTEYTASVLLEVCYKESVSDDGSSSTSEKNNSAQSIYSFARYLPKGYEVLFTSPAYIDEYNTNVRNRNEEMGFDNLTISAGGLNFAIDDDYDVLFTVSYTVSDRGSDPEKMKSLVVGALNSYLEESINKTNDNEKSVYADRLDIISKASTSTVKVNKGVVKSIAIALLIGVVVCFVILLIKYLSDETVGEKEDVEDLTGSTVIAFIPLVQKETSKTTSTTGGSN